MDASLLATLNERAGDPDRAILFTNATIVTMDPALGILDRGDLLVRAHPSPPWHPASARRPATPW